MSPIDEAQSFEPKSPAPEGRKSKPASSAAASPAGADLVAVTVDAASGRIVNVEHVDAGGARREVSNVEKARLLQNGAKATLERVVEQAFEAGIDCVLGAVEEEPPQSEEDTELSRALLRSLIERSAARRLLGRDVLSQAIVATLVEQAAGARAAASEGAAAH
jgi:hypothetical protein